MLRPAEARALKNNCNAAIDDIEAGREAWYDGEFSAEHLAGVLRGQVTLAKYLAEHSDKRLILHFDTLLLMRNYEQIGADLLACYCALQGDRHEERVRSPSGRYAMSRRLIIADRAYEHAVVCTNPAVGAIQLDQWKDDLRHSLHVRMAA